MTGGFYIVPNWPADHGLFRPIELRLPGGESRVVLFTPPGWEDRAGTMLNVVFTCDDIEATYRELVGRGVEFTQPLEKQPWGSGAVLRDSEGNSFARTSRE